MIKKDDWLEYTGYFGWAGIKTGQVVQAAADEFPANGGYYVTIKEALAKYPGSNQNANCFKPTTGPTKNVAGRKDDSGKLDMTLFDDMPRALEAVAEVMQWAITKKQPIPYVRGSWIGVSADRYRAAIKRHDSTACKQASTAPTATPARFQRDDETKLLHLAHEACSALFALELTLREMEVTDVE